MKYLLSLSLFHFQLNATNPPPPNIREKAGSLTMLSSTSLLHGNCIFNRNNTVATQQGMKTYWLCKSYRLTMCRARCITHQGRVISATGLHNHPPHMKGSSNCDYATQCAVGSNATPNELNTPGTMRLPNMTAITSTPLTSDTNQTSSSPSHQHPQDMAGPHDNNSPTHTSIDLPN